jgi:hypothetical protein
MGAQGSHHCDTCGSVMHAFCGTGIGEEGFGQFRRCPECQSKVVAGMIEEQVDHDPEIIFVASRAELEIANEPANRNDALSVKHLRYREAVRNIIFAL